MGVWIKYLDKISDKINHPSDYPWSSFQCNAHGQFDELVTHHREYTNLGITDTTRQSAYRQLFRVRIPETTLETIREAINKAWALGNGRFKRRMEKKLSRPVESRGQGGDRKSGAYRQQMKKSGHCHFDTCV